MPIKVWELSALIVYGSQCTITFKLAACAEGAAKWTGVHVEATSTPYDTTPLNVQTTLQEVLWVSSLRGWAAV